MASRKPLTKRAGSGPEAGSVIQCTNPRIWIRLKMSRLRTLVFTFYKSNFRFYWSSILINEKGIFLPEHFVHFSSKETFLFNYRTCPSLCYLSVANYFSITDNPLTLFFYSIRTLWAGQAGSVSPLPVRGQMFHHHGQSLTLIFTIRTLWAGQAVSFSPLPVRGQMFHHHRQSPNIRFLLSGLCELAKLGPSLAPLPVRGQMFHHYWQFPNINFTIRTLWAGQAGSVSPLPVRGQMFHHHGQSPNIIVLLSGLCELAKLGPSLRYLSVAKCSTITDNGLRHAPQSLKPFPTNQCSLTHGARICKRLRSPGSIPPR